MSKIPLMADHDPVALLPDSEEDEAKIVKSRRLILLLAVMLLVGGIWAWFAVLDEVSTGTGKVIDPQFAGAGDTNPRRRYFNRAERTGRQQGTSRTGCGAPRSHPQRI